MPHSNVTDESINKNQFEQDCVVTLHTVVATKQMKDNFCVGIDC